MIYEESGLASSGGINTITLDGNQSDAVIAGLQLRIVSGTGIGQNRQIASRVNNEITLSSDWTTQPDNTSRYAIFGGWCGCGSGTNLFEDVKEYSEIAIDILYNPGQTIMIIPIFSHDSNGIASHQHAHITTNHNE